MEVTFKTPRKGHGYGSKRGHGLKKLVVEKDMTCMEIRSTLDKKEVNRNELNEHIDYKFIE